MDPIEYLRILRRRWPIIAVVLVLALGAAWITLDRSPPPPGEPVVEPGVTYRATQILLRNGSSPATANLDLVALLAKQGEIPSRVAEALPADVPQTAVADVRIAPDNQLGTVSVTATGATADEAKVVAKTYGTEIIAYFDERASRSRQDQLESLTSRLAAIDVRLNELEQQADALPAGSIEGRLAQSELTVLIEQYGTLSAQYRELSLGATTRGSTFTTLQEPVPVPTTVESDRLFTPPDDTGARLLLAGVAGLVLGLALALMIDRVDTRVRSRRDVEEAFGLPVVAEIPRRGASERRRDPIPAATQPASEAAEAYRALRVSIQLMPRWVLNAEEPAGNGFAAAARALPPYRHPGLARIILVTSAGIGEGKTSTVANLAATLAEGGEKVLVLDCDFRRPALHELFEVSPSPGMSDLLARGAESQDVAGLVRATKIDGVSIIPAGTAVPNPGQLLKPDRRLLSQAAALADVVIVDTGPALSVNDAAALVPESDSVVLVARSGRTSRDSSRRVIELLARVKAPVVGIALVGTTGAGGGYRYYHEDAGHGLVERLTTLRRRVPER